MPSIFWVVLIVGVSTSLGLGAIAWMAQGRHRRARSRPAQEDDDVDDRGASSKTLRQIAAADYARQTRHDKPS